ncbi:hypothetical protein F9278_44685 [Streptomyces phaeolivaceus]|uniref:Uncharacterized protein n=1 Tax=Streptomyces phaeolivaceus TaxID=2653200 RepID=A0A5P8KGF8_9ACTN|nr:hypothetical protein [Streptomyces phaeolivaceus]QFR02091.1 hypothetical protein F9278_44685 [Streptomyces phaeolivaceus]
MSVLTIEPGEVPAAEEPPDTGERHRLTAVTGLAALSLDAMASVGETAAAEPGTRVTVLIAEVEPVRPGGASRAVPRALQTTVLRA